MAEAVWRPDMNPDELFEAVSQSLLNAMDRDAVSGWGAVVHVMYVTILSCSFDLFLFSTPDAVITRTLRARQD